MTSYLKISVLIDFPFEDAIFPFNRGTATSWMTGLGEVMQTVRARTVPKRPHLEQS